MRDEGGGAGRGEGMTREEEVGQAPRNIVIELSLLRWRKMSDGCSGRESD